MSTTADGIIEPWQARIREAAARSTPLRIRGGGTKDFYGERGHGELLDTRSYAGVVDYDPTELVITVRGGTRLADVEQTMAAERQMLAFEPPHFGADATIGGAVASGLSGPRRPYAGAVRDYVLGVRIIDGNGEDLRFGGRVMKNVAGFDVSRLMSGAMGTLGLLLEISLKCLPLARAQRTLVFEVGAGEAIAQMNAWAAQPLPISATCHHAGRLYVRLAGAEPAVDAAARTLGGATVPDAEAFWAGIREQTFGFFASRPTLWRLSIRSTSAPLDVPGEQLIEWGGALRWVSTETPGDASRMRQVAQDHGGHATLFRGDDRRGGVFQPLPEALMTIHRRLKSTFDPAGILNPGRLYPSF